jgi:Flp pilus assembly protein TadG
MQEGKTMRDLANNFGGMSAFNRLIRRLRQVGAMDAGSAIVEMGISCGILFAMFFGVFEIALASYTSHYVADAAREGARFAIVRGSQSCTNTSSRLPNCGASTDTIKAYVKGVQYPGIQTSNMTVNVSYLTATQSFATGSLQTTWATCTSSCNVPGNMVTVQVSYPFVLMLPLVPKETINVSSTSQMVVQQ